MPSWGAEINLDLNDWQLEIRQNVCFDPGEGSFVQGVENAADRPRSVVGPREVGLWVPAAGYKQEDGNPGNEPGKQTAEQGCVTSSDRVTAKRHAKKTPGLERAGNPDAREKITERGS